MMRPEGDIWLTGLRWVLACWLLGRALRLAPDGSAACALEDHLAEWRNDCDEQRRMRYADWAEPADRPDVGPDHGRVEALAESWASIDRKLERFHACKADPKLDMVDGSYAGYTIEAEEMIKRLEERGFTVVPIEPAVSALGSI